HADLDHGGRDEELYGAGGERLHDPRLLFGLQAPVYQADVELGERLGERGMRREGGRELERIRALALSRRVRLAAGGGFTARRVLLDERADPVRLAAGHAGVAHAV